MVVEVPSASAKCFCRVLLPSDSAKWQQALPFLFLNSVVQCLPAKE